MFGEWMEEGKTNIWQGKKQEEAIKYLEFMNGTLDFNKIGYVYAKESIETVLNMLKRQQTDIEIYEKELDKIYKVLNIERGVAGLETAEIIKRLKNTVNEQINMLKEKDKEIEKKDNELKILKQQYKNLENDFDSYKNNKDINYLDGIHHKKLVEKSIGQIINNPEECYFDIFEVKVIRNNILYGVAINEDFVSLKQISDENPEECITVIAESPLSGAIYRYNNYGDKKWQLIGTMLGYA